MFQSHCMLVCSESGGPGRAPGRGRGAQSIILSEFVSQAQGLEVWATCRADPGLSQGHVQGGSLAKSEPRGGWQTPAKSQPYAG